MRLQFGDRAGVALLVTGVLCVVAGGLVAAVADPLDVPRGSWLAAYLVLVGGVGQVSTGLARTAGEVALSSSDRLGWGQFAAWNLGNALVIIGTLTAAPVLVTVGGLVLLVALVLALLQTRGRASSAWVTLYRLVLAVMVISIPVGLALSFLRHR